MGVAIAGAMFENRLSTLIKRYAPDLSPSLASAAKQSPMVVHMLQGEDQNHVIRAYSEAIGKSLADPDLCSRRVGDVRKTAELSVSPGDLGYIFIFGICASIVASLSAIMVKNYDMRKVKRKPAMADEKGKERSSTSQ